MHQSLFLTSGNFLIVLSLTISIRASLSLPSFVCKQTTHYNLHNHPTQQSFTIIRSRKYNMDPSRETSLDANQIPLSKKNPKGVLYIPIGPQCCGKTTFLTGSLPDSNFNSSSLVDISIDDQEGVYLKIPSHHFLTDSDSDHSSRVELLQTVVHNKSISERIYDKQNNEQRWIAQRLCNEITADEFRNRIMTLDDTTQSVWHSLLQTDGDEATQGSNEPVDWRIFLLEAVEGHVFDTKSERFETIDLFVVESIFKNPTENMTMLLGITSSTPSTNGVSASIDWPVSVVNQKLSGLNAASTKLDYLARRETHLSIAWGNTNAVSSFISTSVFTESN